MAQIISVRLNKGESPSLGFRLQGGKDFGTPLVIQKVNIGSPAEKAGLLAGDSVIKINNSDVFNLRHKDAQDVIIRAGHAFEITVQRGGSTWKPSVAPTGPVPAPQPAINSISPVTKTSLAAKSQTNIGAIGTGHNLSAKPFASQLNGTVNGTHKLVNKQYNSPVGLYSEESIAETLSAQTEVLSTGVLGVNFKKNEKNYDASNSAVFRMVQEADKEPKDQEPEVDSGVVSAPSGVAGLRHVSAPENKPAPASPQLPPGQNICADCERLIVGVFVRIKDKNLHVECFKCATCGTSLKNVGYYNINNKLYCDVHAKLAARSNPPAPNLVPVTLPPGKTSAGLISSALTNHPLPTAAPLSPLSQSTNTVAQPFQAGTNFSSPRPFSSVSAPLSPPASNYSAAPKPPPVAVPYSPPVSAPAPDKGRTIHNIVWPPPPDEPEIPTATPLYFPPKSRVATPPNNQVPDRYSPPPASKITVQPWQKQINSDQKQTYIQSETRNVLANINKTEELKQSFHDEELSRYLEKMDPKMSLCSAEVTNIVDRRCALEHIETVAETQMFVESVLKQRPKSPPPVDEDIKPKVEVQTAPTELAKSSTTEPRIVTKVCVCTNSCCNATEGKLCESCPLREPAQLKRPGDYQQSKQTKPGVQNTVPRRYESPKITGVSVTIDNPGKIKDSPDTFAQIPTKKTTSALGSALSVAPVEPFTPVSPVFTNLEPVPLPEETVPYLPPARHITTESKVQVTKENVQKSESQLVKIQESSFLSANNSASVKKFAKKSKEDQLLKDLPKPTQWMSMISALTTAPDRPYSPFVVETATKQTEVTEEVHIQEITKLKETQQDILKRSAHNETVLPKPFTKPVILEKFEPVNDNRETPQMHFPPISDELKSSSVYKADYSEIKNEISSQIIEQAHLEESCQKIEKCQKTVCNKKECESKIQNTNKIEKQTEQAIIKKPLELTGYLHKAEYLPQYQVSLNYDETIQLPHHKDIKKLLPNEQNKQDTKRSAIPKSVPSTQGHLQQTNEPKVSVPQFKENVPTVKPVTTINPGEINLSIPQMSFRPVDSEKPPRTTFSPRPGSLTPSMINKPAPVLPHYQADLVATEHLAPEINLYDPKSPQVSRSPSPCPGRRSPSPFPKQSPRPVSPAPGPPPNPLAGSRIPKFTKEDRQKEEAKKNITAYIPQYKQKASSEECVQRTVQIFTPEQQILQNKEHVSSQGQYEQTQSSASAYQSQIISSASQQALAAASVSAKQSQQIGISQSKSIQRSTANSVQIEKRQFVSEEYEHSQKSKVEIKQVSGSTSEHAFRNVNNPEIEEQGIIGLHVTNPQPINSPFITKQKVQALPQSKPQPLPKSQSNTKTAAPYPTNISKQVQPVKCPVPTATPTPSVSTNKPTVPLPNTGSGGGRQAGAIGVAPKRGRGVLNVAGFAGSRIPLCGQCHGQIRGPFITALGKLWCPEHFICNTSSCKRPLQDLGFVEEQGKLYCEYCFEQYLAPPCSKCSAKIKGDCLKAIGRNFHPECFNCSHCGKLFGNSPFFLEDGEPYCENDWNELFTTKCFACGFPVEAGDRWVEALNNNYHSQCFNCTMCKKNLEGQSFFAKGGRPFCKNHAR